MMHEAIDRIEQAVGDLDRAGQRVGHRHASGAAPQSTCTASLRKMITPKVASTWSRWLRS